LKISESNIKQATRKKDSE